MHRGKLTVVFSSRGEAREAGEAMSDGKLRVEF